MMDESQTGPPNPGDSSDSKQLKRLRDAGEAQRGSTREERGSWQQHLQNIIPRCQASREKKGAAP